MTSRIKRWIRKGGVVWFLEAFKDLLEEDGK